jgi:deoxyribose-phosphate aldolase
VYPARVKDAANTLTSLKLVDLIPIASVATGFPSGQYHLETRLEEVRQAVRDGASEIDIVINRTAALKGDWKGLKNILRKYL